MNERDAVLAAFRRNPNAVEELRKLHDGGGLKYADEIPDEETLVIVGGPWPGNVSGNKQVRCVTCSCLLAISPSTQEMIAIRKGESRISCFDCVAKKTPPEKVC